MGNKIGQYKSGHIWVTIFDDGTYHCDNWDDDARGLWKIVDGDLHFMTYCGKEWQIGHRRDGAQTFLNIVNKHIDKELLGDDER